MSFVIDRSPNTIHSSPDTTSMKLSAQYLMACMLILMLGLSSCSFETLENSIRPDQLIAVDTSTNGSSGVFSWTVGSDNFNSKAKYVAATRTISAKIDADNFLEISFLSSGTGPAVGSYTFSSVAINPSSVSVNMKQRKSDNSGFICYGVGISGTLVISEMQSNKIKGSFSFNSSAAELYTGKIINVNVSGSFHDVPY